MPDFPAPSIPGAEQLVEWFGGWPSFHDAEVLEICLHREGKSWLRIHAWRTTREVDSPRPFVFDRHAVVSFWFEGVLDLELADFSIQNVISWLGCETKEKSVRVTMYPCYGIAGYVEAERVSVSLEPGNPREIK
jgi:hypothetical protein